MAVYGQPSKRKPMQKSPTWLVVLVGVIVIAACTTGGLVLTSGGEESDAAPSPTPATNGDVEGYLAALTAIHPAYANHSEQSLVSDGENTCLDINTGEPEDVLLNRVRARYARDDIEVDDALAQRILTEVILLLCPEATQ